MSKDAKKEDLPGLLTNKERSDLSKIAKLFAEKDRDHLFVSFAKHPKESTLQGDYYFKANDLRQFAHYLINIAQQDASFMPLLIEIHAQITEILTLVAKQHANNGLYVPPRIIR